VSVGGLDTANSSIVYVPLEPGWNQLSSPFVIPVDWLTVYVGLNYDDALAAGSLASNSSNGFVYNKLYYWDGSGSYVASSALLPGEGYWVYNKTSSACVLYIPKPLAKPSGGGGQVSYKALAPGDPLPPAPPGSFGSGSQSGGSGGAGGCSSSVSTGNSNSDSSGPCILILIFVVLGLSRLALSLTNARARQ
jgi:hypothetical protein